MNAACAEHDCTRNPCDDDVIDQSPTKICHIETASWGTERKGEEEYTLLGGRVEDKRRVLRGKNART